MTQIPFGTRIPRGSRSAPYKPEPKPREIIPDRITLAVQQRKREIAEKPLALRVPMRGPCPKCGKVFKGLRKHYTHCKE